MKRIVLFLVCFVISQTNAFIPDPYVPIDRAIGIGFLRTQARREIDRINQIDQRKQGRFNVFRRELKKIKPVDLGALFFAFGFVTWTYANLR